MDWRRLSPSFWAVLLVLGSAAVAFGLAVGGLLFGHEVRVEVPVEVVRTIERVVEKPAELTDEQQLWLKMMGPAREAAASPSVGYLETSVMPFRNKVKVVVLMSDAINEAVPRAAVQTKVEQALREVGLEVVPADSDAGGFNTTVFMVFDLMQLPKAGQLVGEVRLNLNQTLLCFSDDVWRKCNVTTASFGTTVSYNADNYGKILEAAVALAPEAGKVLRKADEIGAAMRTK